MIGVFKSILRYFIQNQVFNTPELPMPVDIVNSKYGDESNDYIYNVKNDCVESIGWNRTSIGVTKNLAIPVH